MSVFYRSIYAVCLGVFLAIPFSGYAQEEASVEIVNQKVPGTKHYVAEVRPKNFPPDKQLMFYAHRALKLNPKEQDPGMFCYTDQNGQLADQQERIIDELLLPSIGFMPGEMQACSFRSTDNEFSHDFSYVPVPWIIRSSNGAWSVEVKIHSKEIYSLTVNGIEESEMFKLLATSGDEKISHESTFGSNSSSVLLYPAVKGKEGGKAYFRLERKDGSFVEAHCLWGFDLLVKLFKQNKGL
jgi:hypothetical protein